MGVELRVFCCVCAAIMLICSCMTAMAEETALASQALNERMVISFAAYGEWDTQGCGAPDTFYSVKRVASHIISWYKCII